MTEATLLRIQIVTPVGRLSYPHLFSPQTNDQGEERFKTAIFFADGVSLAAMQQAAMDVGVSAFGTDVADLFRSKKVRWPFRSDADDVKERGYPEGSTFVNMSAKQRPGVVDAAVQDVLDVGEAYAGRDAIISATAYSYDVSGNKGVTFGLNHVQLLGHNDRLDGRKDASEVFQRQDEVLANLDAFEGDDGDGSELPCSTDDDISDLVGK